MFIRLFTFVSRSVNPIIQLGRLSAVTQSGQGQCGRRVGQRVQQGACLRCVAVVGSVEVKCSSAVVLLCRHAAVAAAVVLLQRGRRGSRHHGQGQARQGSAQRSLRGPQADAKGRTVEKDNWRDVALIFYVSARCQDPHRYASISSFY